MSKNDPNEPWEGFNAGRPAGPMMVDVVQVTAILDSEHGKRNPTLARKLALEDRMDPAQAESILAMVPGSENPHGASDSIYARALLADGASGLGGGASGAIGGDPRAERLAEIKRAAESVNASRGYGPPSGPTRRGV